MYNSQQNVGQGPSSVNLVLKLFFKNNISEKVVLKIRDFPPLITLDIKPNFIGEYSEIIKDLMRIIIPENSHHVQEHSYIQTNGTIGFVRKLIRTFNS